MLNIYLAMLETQEDKDKMTELYETYREYLCNIAQSILHSKDDAEDVLHEAFLRIANDFTKIGEVSSRKTENVVCGCWITTMYDTTIYIPHGIIFCQVFFVRSSRKAQAAVRLWSSRHTAHSTSFLRRQLPDHSTVRDIQFNPSNLLRVLSRENREYLP